MTTFISGVMSAAALAALVDLPLRSGLGLVAAIIATGLLLWGLLRGDDPLERLFSMDGDPALAGVAAAYSTAQQAAARGAKDNAQRRNGEASLADIVYGGGLRSPEPLPAWCSGWAVSPLEEASPAAAAWSIVLPSCGSRWKCCGRADRGS